MFSLVFISVLWWDFMNCVVVLNLISLLIGWMWLEWVEKGLLVLFGLFWCRMCIIGILVVMYCLINVFWVVR